MDIHHAQGHDPIIGAQCTAECRRHRLLSANSVCVKSIFLDMTPRSISALESARRPRGGRKVHAATGTDHGGQRLWWGHTPPPYCAVAWRTARPQFAINSSARSRGRVGRNRRSGCQWAASARVSGQMPQDRPAR